MWPSLADCLGCLCIICDSGRKSARRPSKSRTRERSRDACPSARAAWAHLALPVQGKNYALGCGDNLYLSAPDRTGVLVAVAFLDGGDTGRRADFANVASLDRADFFSRRRANVRPVGARDALDRE